MSTETNFTEKAAQSVHPRKLKTQKETHLSIKSRTTAVKLDNNSCDVQQKLSYSNSCTALERPCRFQEVKFRGFQDSRVIKVARLSAPRAGLLYRPGIIPGSHFC